MVATELAGRKVQPIRLKELEEPRRGQRVCVQTLFDVLAVYRSRPGVSIDPQFQGVVTDAGVDLLTLPTDGKPAEERFAVTEVDATA